MFITKTFIGPLLFSTTRLDAIRERELKQLRKYQILNIVSSAMWATAPILTALATFAVYSAAYGELTPATAFTAVSLFNVLRFPLTMFPNTITSAVEANVSVKRLEQFLSSSEITGDFFFRRLPLKKKDALSCWLSLGV